MTKKEIEELGIKNTVYREITMIELLNSILKELEKINKKIAK